MPLVRTLTFICLSMLIILQSSLTSAYDGVLWLNNRTGSDIDYLYVRHEDAVDWGPDVLGERKLDADGGFTLDRAGYSSSLFDVKAVVRDGVTSEDYIVRDVDIAVDTVFLTRGHIVKDPVANGSRYIEVINITGYSIHQLYVQHEDAAAWAQNVLGDNTLEDGDHVRIDLPSATTSIFNIKAIDEEGDVYPAFGVDVDETNLNLTLDYLKQKAPDGVFKRYIEVTNRTGRDIDSLQVYPEFADDWGPEALSDQVLADGDSIKVGRDGHASSIFTVKAVARDVSGNATDLNNELYLVHGIDIAYKNLTLTRDHIIEEQLTLGDRYIDIFNDTGGAIFNLHFKHEDTDHWEQDTLAGEYLEDGESFRIYLPDTSTPIFSIMAIDVGFDRYPVIGINAGVERVSITRDDLDNDMPINGLFSGHVTVNNHTREEMHCLYIKHEDSNDWGENRLGHSVLTAGSKQREVLEGYHSSRFDIRAVDSTGQVYAAYGRDIAVWDVDLNDDKLVHEPVFSLACRALRQSSILHKQQ